MAFVVEDGTGLPNSNSYASVAEADAYFADRNNTVWAAIAAGDKEVNLIRATDYIDSRWYSALMGDPLTTSQALQFPRDSFTGLPQTLKRACFEYALQANSGSLMPAAPTTITGSGAVTLTRKKAGPLEIETRYADASSSSSNSSSIYRSYPAGDTYMKPLLTYGTGNKVYR